MVISQGDVWWADIGQPTGSAAAFRRPVVVVQSDSMNRSQIATVICVPLTSNLKWAVAPGNVLLRAKQTGLPKNSVANVSLVVAIDKQHLLTHCGKISKQQLAAIFDGLDIVMGR